MKSVKTHFWRDSVLMSNKYPNSLKSTNSSTVAHTSCNTSLRYWKSRTQTSWSSSCLHDIWEDVLWLTTTTGFQWDAVWKHWMSPCLMSLRFWRDRSAGGIAASWGSFWTYSSCARTRSEACGWRRIFGTPKGSRWKRDGVSGIQLDAVTSLIGLHTDWCSVIVHALWTSHITVL